VFPIPSFEEKSMSFLKVNTITGNTGTNAPVFSTGIQVLETTNPVAISTITADTINVTGIVTAAQFIGNGSGLTSVQGVTPAKCFAFTVIN
jgi:hypothetical protein